MRPAADSCEVARGIIIIIDQPPLLLLWLVVDLAAARAAVAHHDIAVDELASGQAGKRNYYYSCSCRPARPGPAQAGSAGPNRHPGARLASICVFDFLLGAYSLNRKWAGCEKKAPAPMSV